MEFRVMTPDEEQARYEEMFPEQAAAEKRRAEWDDKHPRCEGCGQFLKKRAVPAQGTPFSLFLDYEIKGQWVSHYVQDYWGEWDHI